MGGLLALLQAPSGFAQQSIHFIGNKSTAEDDKLLRTFLTQKTGLQFQTHAMSLNTAVRRLSDWKENERYLAHMTPYACVAAEMLGANFEILATYMRKTRDTARPLSSVYHSYFVINREDAQRILHHEPDLTDVPKYLEKQYFEDKKPAKFVYHDKFSTSSFFLPSLYFRDSHIAAVTEAALGSIIPIVVERPAGITGSSSLVEEVAAGNAQLAAVWDATVEDQKAKLGDKVYFLQLPSAIPNDLLILSRAPGSPAQDPLRDEILRAIRATEDYKNSDGKWNGRDNEYQYWVSIKDAPEALDALGDLRRIAQTNPHYVTVAVRWSAKQKEQPDLLRAVEYGIRLSGAEFVNYNKDFHKRVDVTWTLESIHDGAVALTSQIGEQGLVTPQSFSISFMSPDDLTTRVAALVLTRMHRIRYIWPYQDIYPAVIRDLDFKPQSTVVAQRIVWTDSERNEYEEGIPFESTLVQQYNDFYKFQLSGGFPVGQEGSYQFEPMSNVAYRVILKRVETEAPLFRYLTWALVALLALFALALAWDARRKQPPPAGFPRTYEALVNEYHRPWHDRQIREADVLWCDPQIDQFINQFRGSNPLSQEVGKITIPGVHLSVAAVQWIFHRIFAEKLKLAPELINAKDAGTTAAVDRLIRYLIRGGRLSSFTGRPLEWDSLDDMVRRMFYRLNIGQSLAGARVQRDASLGGMVARHFQEVLERGRVACLFHHRWEAEEVEKGFRLTHAEDLGGDLRLILKEGTAVGRTLVLEFEIPLDGDERSGFGEALAASDGEAWVLATVPGPLHRGQNGSGDIRVPLKPIALLRRTSEVEVLPAPKPAALMKGAA